MMKLRMVREIENEFVEYEIVQTNDMDSIQKIRATSTLMDLMRDEINMLYSNATCGDEECAFCWRSDSSFIAPNDLGYDLKPEYERMFQANLKHV